MFAAKFLHAAEKWNAVGAAAVAPESLREEDLRLPAEIPCSRRSASSCARVHSRPITSVSNFSARRWRRTRCSRDFAALGGKLDVAGAANAEVAAARHTFQGGGDGGRRNAEIFGKPRADGRLLFLDELPDSFEVIFLGDAGFFAAQVR